MLAILYGAPSILFTLAAVWLMRNFPIDEAEHRRIRDALAAAGA
jgi:GPH family glycoside/pentoside/hexuronide:cation symporter